jgi:hypothetical protein
MPKTNGGNCERIKMKINEKRVIVVTGDDDSVKFKIMMIGRKFTILVIIIIFIIM